MFGDSSAGNWFNGRLRSCLMLAILLIGLLWCHPACAVRFTDDTDAFWAEIPDNDAVLYYTPESHNLPEDVFGRLRAADRNIRLHLRRYDHQNVLESVLEVSTLSVPPGIADSAASTPAQQSKTSDFTNILDVPETLRDEAMDLVREALAERFELSNTQTSEFDGVPALSIHGTGLAHSSWNGFDAQIYLITDKVHFLTITDIYRNSTPSNSAADFSLLNLLHLGRPEPQPTLTASQVTEAASAGTPLTAAAPAGTATPSASMGISSMEPASDLFGKTASALWLLAAAAALAAAIVLLLHRRTTKAPAFAQESHAAEGSETGRPQLQLDKRITEEDPMEASDLPSQHADREYDYTEDISRYTQQPSADVNDVSRYTHGYEDEFSEQLNAAQEKSQAYTPIRIQSVGSRVERNRRRKKKR